MHAIDACTVYGIKAYPKEIELFGLYGDLSIDEEGFESHLGHHLHPIRRQVEDLRMYSTNPKP